MFQMEKLLVNTAFVKQPDVYNLTSGGFGGGAFGRIVSKEQRARISKMNKGRKPSPLALKRLNESPIGRMRGKKHSEETKRKIRESGKRTWADKELRRKLGEGRIGNQWAKGYKWTDEQRARLSRAITGRKRPKHSEKTKLKRVLSRQMGFAKKKGDANRLVELQSQYRNLCGSYHPKYLDFV